MRLLRLQKEAVVVLGPCCSLQILLHAHERQHHGRETDDHRKEHEDRVCLTLLATHVQLFRAVLIYCILAVSIIRIFLIVGTATIQDVDARQRSGVWKQP
jgi:hypothetical protein